MNYLNNCTVLRLTADKMEIKDFPKFPSCLRADTHRQAATSFISETSGKLKEINKNGQFQ